MEVCFSFFFYARNWILQQHFQFQMYELFSFESTFLVLAALKQVRSVSLQFWLTQCPLVSRHVTPLPPPSETATRRFYASPN